MLTVTGRQTTRLTTGITLADGASVADGGGGNVDVRVGGITKVSVTTTGEVFVNGTLDVGGEMTESVNGYLSAPIPRTLTGTDVMTYLQAARDSATINTRLDTVRTGPTGNGGLGGVLMRDGRVFIVPRDGTAAYIFDPSTNAMSSVGTFPAGNKFYGGTLLHDGRVFFIPCEVTYTNIFDPTTNTVSTPNVTFPGGTLPFVFGVTLPDGRVFLNPFSSTYALIYNPTTDTISTPNVTFPGAYTYQGSVLLPDGRVFMVPLGSSQTRALLFDPATNTVTSTSASFGSTANKYLGAVLMPNGNVFCIPANATTSRIFNPTTGEVTTPSVTFPGGVAFGFGCLLPDGRVFLTPWYSTTARIFNPVTNTLSTPSGLFSAISAPRNIGSVLLPDGRVFVVPYGPATEARTVHTGGWGSVRLPTGVLTSPFLNTT